MKKRFLGLALILLMGGSAARALTLPDSVDIALKHNPSVLAAQKKLDAANARLAQAVGAFFPNIKLSGNYADLHSDPQVMQVTVGGQTQTFNVATATVSKSWAATLSQPVLQAGLFPGLKMAQRASDAAAQDLRKTVNDTTYNVTAAYFGVLSADKLAKVAVDSLALANSHLAQVQAMLSSGVATRADLLRADVQVANSEVALTRARNNLDLARNTFNNVLGQPIDQAVVLADAVESSVPIPPDYPAVLQTAYDNRPDWLSFLDNRKIAEENVALARTGYWPTVNFSAQTGNTVTDYPGFEASSNAWSLTGAASWTLFDGLGTQNRINEAAANLEVQKATEEQVRSNVALDVRNALLNLRSVIETIASTKKAVDFAEESYKVSSLRFSSGVGTNIEVIDAQVALIQARTDYLKSHFDLEVSKAWVNQAAGTEVM